MNTLFPQTPTAVQPYGLGELAEEVLASIEKIRAEFKVPDRSLVVPDDSKYEDGTTYLLKSEHNTERLLAAMHDLRHGKGIQRSVESLREEFGLTDDGEQ